jgi:phage terminase large subunit
MFTDYRTVPRKWLGEAFINKVKQCYITNPNEYAWRYLGEVVGMEGLVFKNIMQWKFCYQDYDLIVQGLDLGWADPKVVVRWGIKFNTANIYCIDEFYQSYTENQVVANWIADNQYNDIPTILESAGGAEAQSIYTSYGVPTQIVNKGNNLKRNALEYLLSRAHICIDPERTPNTYREFSQYEWKKDKLGQLVQPEQPIAYNDHTIDATRYALQPHLSILEAL